MQEQGREWEALAEQGIRLQIAPAWYLIRVLLSFQGPSLR